MAHLHNHAPIYYARVKMQTTICAVLNLKIYKPDGDELAITARVVRLVCRYAKA